MDKRFVNEAVVFEPGGALRSNHSSEKKDIEKNTRRKGKTSMLIQVD
jgi:hypothetical protein